MRIVLDKEARTRLDAILAEPAGRRIGVLGLGVAGLAMARLLVSRGAVVVGADLRDAIQTDISMQMRLGAMSAETFADVEALVISPGADPRQEAIAAAAAKGVPILGELELTSPLPARVAAITGTNGKSTTTALLGELVKGSRKSAFVGGNLGEPIAAWLGRGEGADVAVLELSSFQLETAYSFRADVGVVLNVTPDHLERYASIESYADVKQRLVENARIAVLNADDACVAAMAKVAAGDLLWWSTAGSTLPADGALLRGDQIEASGKVAALDGFDLTHPRLVGRHNRENAIAALLSAVALGLDDAAALRKAYLGFAKLEHRLELVGEKRGIQFFNDSKATNDGSAAIAAAAMDRPTILLAGGRDKGGGYGELVGASRAQVRRVIAYGEAGDEIAAAFAGVVEVERAEGMRRAMTRALEIAAAGDAVLLAPACSSFDEFDNFRQRGEVFKAWVASIEGEAP